MNEAVAATLPQAETESGADRVAVALELAPLLAMLMPFAAILTIHWEDLEIGTLLYRTAVIALASGLGWLKVGRPLHAVGIAASRGLVLALLVWWAYSAVGAEVAVRNCDDVCDASNPLIPSIVPVVLVAGAYVVSTIVSAAFVAKTSRLLRAAQPIATTPGIA